MSEPIVFYLHVKESEEKIKRFVVTANNRDQARERVKQSASVARDDDIQIFVRPPLIWDHKEAFILFA